ncbi:substrate-binding periplasmic protein [Marinobacter sp. SS21]|uniref:substrate-binding periplasmic protein n=1 Tax=Marinobacter sp. SS21 TaxID=2979460 RepID=UPI00232EF62D|nr:transporter substrate-binding domain-containing protein [Marinobacter sp. SS21]MDC0661573.1 transporter substrate-binding domain-containing protein [Marinobacter sp. SS21]
MNNLIGLLAAVGFLLLIVLPSLAPADTLPCRVVVGPTSDPELTVANRAWTKQLVRHLESRGTRCEMIFVDAWARANMMFAERRIDVLFPEIVGDASQPGITGRPVALTYGFVVYSRLDTRAFDHPAELRGRRVGIIRGRYYPASLLDDPHIRIESANSLEQNFNKLLHGRIDATVEYQSDGLQQLAAMNLLNRVQYGQEFGVGQLAYRFQATPEGEQLKTRFDQAIRTLMDNGTYTATFRGTSQRLVP